MPPLRGWVVALAERRTDWANETTVPAESGS